MSSELTVIIKDDEKTLRTKYLIYEKFTVSDNDPIIQDCVQKTLKNFDGEPTDINVKIALSMK